MQNCLAEFTPALVLHDLGEAYRIAVPWWIFLLAGAENVVLVLATIAYHALKVAMMNPVKSLRE